MDNNLKKLNVIGIIIAIVATLLIGLFIGLIVSGGDKTLNSIIQNSQGKQAREVVDVKFDLVNDKSAYLNIYGNDKDGNQVWSYKTKEQENPGQNISIERIGVMGDKVIINEMGTLIALNKQTGEKVWENSEYGGVMSKYTNDENGNLFFTGYSIPNLFVIDSNGKTLKNIKQFKNNLSNASEIKIADGKLTLTFPQKVEVGGESQEYNAIITSDVESLINTDESKTTVKTMKPSFHVDINNIVLSQDGEVIFYMKSDSQLGKKYGASYQVAANVKRIYMAEWGNGGYFDLIIVGENNSTKIINGRELIDENKIEPKSLNIKADFIVTVSEFDANDYAIVDKDGKLYFKGKNEIIEDSNQNSSNNTAQTTNNTSNSTNNTSDNKYNEAVSEIKKCFLDENWVRDNVMMKVDTFNNSITPQGKVSFIKVVNTNYPPMFIVENYADAISSSQTFIVYYKDGKVVVNPMAVLHISHSAVSVDPNNAVVSVGYMHMGYMDREVYDIKDGNKKLIVKLSANPETSSAGETNQKYFKNAGDNQTISISEEEYNKEQKKLEKYKFVNIGTELNKANVEAFVK